MLALRTFCLSRHKEDIRGRVLEVGDNFYTRKFGGDRVTVSDAAVLHVVEGNPRGRLYVADLTRGSTISRPRHSIASSSPDKDSTF